MLNSASVMVKLYLPLLFRGSYALDFPMIGALMAAYGVGCMIGAYASGALMSRVDPRMLTAASLCVSGGLVLNLALLPATVWLFILVPATGAADGAFRPANLRLVMEAGSPDDATWLQGLHRVSFNFGVALAGLTAAGLSGIGYPTLFAVAGIANIAGGCLLARHAGGGAAHHATAAPSRCEAPVDFAPSPWADRAFLLFVLGQLLALGVFDQMYGTFGLFLIEDYQIGTEWIGYLFSFNAALIVLAQAPAMALIARIGLVSASRLGTLLLTVAFPLLNVGRSPAYAFAAMACITAAEVLLTPAWALAIINRSAGRDRGRYLGIFSAAWLGHSLYGPASGTWIYGAFGGHTLWWVCATTGLAVWVFHWRTLPELSRSSAA